MTRMSEPVPDPRMLRAIAHPVRSRILSELGAAGCLRAADVARLIGIPANQASFHLRQLAKYGLAVEAPEEARDRRDRVWKPVAEGGVELQMQGMAGTPEGRSAVRVWQRNSAAWARHVVSAAYDWPTDQVDDEEDPVFVGIVNTPIRLSAEEAEELSGELGDVLKRWRERQRGRDDARTYLFFSTLQPYPDIPEAD